MTAPIYRREARLVLELVEYVDQAGRPVAWNELVDRFSGNGEHSWRTIENVIYELVAFGALHKVGRPGRPGADTRALKITDLGSAWLRGVVPPLVGG